MAKKEKKKFEIYLGGVNHTDIMLFTKHLSVTLKSGLTVYEGIEILEDQAEGKMKQVLRKIMAIIKAGKPLYEALSEYPKYFTPVYVNLVKIGELSGNLEGNLNHLAEQLHKSYELKQKVKSAMMYPMFILIAVAGLGLSVAIFILPKILPLFQTLDVELPITTRMLIWVAEMFQHHGMAMAGGSIGGTVFLFWFLRRKFVHPVTHRIMLKAPILKGILKNINLERFTRTLGILLMSAVPLDEGLKIVANATPNYLYNKAINSAIPEVVKGNSLLSAFGQYPELFPKITSRMIGMGEKTGSLEVTLKYLSEFYEGEVDNTMKNLSVILEPVLMIFIGVVVGMVAMAVLGPIYKITGSMRG